MSSLADRLQAARALITPREAWCQGMFGADKNGDGTPWDAPAAVRWCMGGACLKTAPGDYDQQEQMIKALATVIGPSEFDGPLGIVCQANNNSTHEQVLAYFDKAIAAAREEDHVDA